MTEWRPVVGFEGVYEVSDSGQVRSLDRTVAWAGRLSRRVGRELKMGAHPNGHLNVVLWRDATSHTRKVHHLVLEAFVGARPPGLEGCHGNGIPADNALGNLRWDTPSANQYDTVRHGHHHEAIKERCPHDHVLAAPNLRAAPALRGHRICLACHRAGAAASRARKAGLTYDLDELRRVRYAAIMKAA